MLGGARQIPVGWVATCLFAVIAVVAGGAGYWFYQQETETIKRQKCAELQAIGDLKSDQIVAWRQERLWDVTLHSKDVFMRNAIAEWRRNADSDAIKSYIVQRLEMVCGHYNYQNALLADPERGLLFSLDPRVTHLEPETKALVLQVLASGAAAFGDMFRCPHCNQVHLDVAAPILDDAERPVAALVLRSDPEAYLYPLIQSWPLPSRSAETLLTRRDGDDVLFLNDLRHRPDCALALRIPLSRKEVAAVQAALGRIGTFEGRDYRGVAVLADIRPVPDSPWFLVAKVDAAEIFAEARYRGLMILLVVMLGIALTAGAMALLFNNRERRLYQRLYAGERERRNRLEEIRAILYGIGDGVIATDAAGCITRMNPAAESITGWNESEALGRPLDEVFRIINEDTRAEVENPVARVLREGQIVALANHTMLISKDGTERPIADSGAPVYDETGAIIGVALVFRDQSAERATEAERRRLSMAVEHAAEAIVVTDQTGEIQYVNPAFERITGYSRAEAIGQTPRILKSGKHDAGFYKRMWDALTRGEVWTGRFTNRRKDGNLYEEEKTISPVVDEEGKIVNYVAIGRDVSDRVSLERRLRQAQKMEAIGALAGGIAHDFNNVLAAIIGYGQMADSALPADSPLHRDLGQVLTAAERARQLVHQILTLGRQEEQDRQPVELGLVVQEAIKLLRPSLPSTIEIQTHINQDAGLVFADPTQMHQVIMNLCTNAYHAMQTSGGVLKVSVDAFEADAQFVQSRPGLHEGPYVLLSVSDTGCGMDAETLERIFDPFFTTKPKGEGTGLGLATVHGIVSAHGGVVYAYSQPGKGSTFHVYLPRSDLVMAGEPLPMEPVRGGHERILVVDDEPPLAQLMEAMLKRYGYDVITMASATEALAAFQKSPYLFDLLISDFTMPKLTGDQLAAEVRRVRPELPVIVMTGFADDALRERLIQSGITVLLTKPISAEKIAKAVREALDKRPDTVTHNRRI